MLFLDVNYFTVIPFNLPLGGRYPFVVLIQKTRAARYLLVEEILAGFQSLETVHRTA